MSSNAISAAPSQRSSKLNEPTTAAADAGMAPRDKPDMCTDEARALGCSCRLSSVNSASIDPPEPVMDEWCPVHGRDPDYEMEKRRDSRD